MTITRRELAAVIAAAAVPLSAEPQADEETTSAHEALKTNAQQLDKIALPMATEPAFQFKA